MTDEPTLSDTSRTETVVRHFDESGKVTSGTVTTVVFRHPPEEDLKTGMYL